MLTPIVMFLAIGLALPWLNRVEALRPPADKVPPETFAKLTKQAETASWICLGVGVAVVPLWLVARRDRCRADVDEQGVRFFPERAYGGLSFRWDDVRDWEPVTTHTGDAEHGASSTELELTLRDGRTHVLPERHRHPAIEAELTRRLGTRSARQVVS
ncbi:MAG: hypothetical protein QM811_13195 [Pirellulales bacterium]